MLPRILSAPARLRAWYAQFRVELREHFTPLPDPPGAVNTSLYNPEVWERVTPAQTKLAFQLALQQSWVTWRTLGELAVGRPVSALPPPPPPEDESIGADNGVAALGPLRGKTLTAEDARAAMLRMAQGVAGGVTTLSRDEAFRGRLVALGSETLTLARDALDELLLGYEEGKAMEIRAFIDEQTEAQTEFMERFRRIKAEVDAAAAASDGLAVGDVSTAAVSAIENTGSTAGVAAPVDAATSIARVLDVLEGASLRRRPPMIVRPLLQPTTARAAPPPVPAGTPILLRPVSHPPLPRGVRASDDDDDGPKGRLH